MASVGPPRPTRPGTPDEVQFQVPEGYYQPFAVITESDHGGWIIIATALGMALVLVASVIRATVRSTFGQSFGMDDAFLAVATLLAFLQESVVLAACSKGLGRSVQLVVHKEELQKLYYAANVLMPLPIALTRMSVACFILRLTPVKLQRWVVYGVQGLTVAWAIMATILMALQCNHAHPWLVLDQSCAGSFTKVVVIRAIDIFSELAIFSSTVYLVSDLKTVFVSKALVVGAFAFRLLLVVPSAFRLATYSRNGLTTDFSLAEAEYVVWTEVELNYSLIAATIPVMRPFINSLSSYWGSARAYPEMIESPQSPALKGDTAHVSHAPVAGKRKSMGENRAVGETLDLRSMELAEPGITHRSSLETKVHGGGVPAKSLSWASMSSALTLFTVSKVRDFDSFSGSAGGSGDTWVIRREIAIEVQLESMITV